MNYMYIMERIPRANYQETNQHGHWKQSISNAEIYKVKLDGADDIYINQVLPRLLANTRQAGIKYISIETVIGHFTEWLTLRMLTQPFNGKSVEDLTYIAGINNMIIMLSSHYDFYVIQNVKNELLSGTIYLSTANE